MSLRSEVSYFAKELKEEYGYSYTDLEGITGFTRKQISFVMNGKSGVSFDKLEEFFREAFDVELSIGISKKLN